MLNHNPFVIQHILLKQHFSAVSSTALFFKSIQEFYSQDACSWRVRNMASP